MSFSSLSHCVTVVLIQVYNWDIQHHSLVCCCGLWKGYCENISQGAVRVELWVGQCSGNTLGDAHTGWESVSRIMIEEVSRPQS